MSFEPRPASLTLTQDARKNFSVSDLTRHIRLTLEENFGAVWVEGEATGVKRHSSGHLYFSIKDENAQLACVMFREQNRRVGFELSDGMSLVCFGRLSVYGARGQYQLYAEHLEPKGVGALQIRFEKLKEKLRLEGLFDESRKRPLPFLPRTIGLVTSIDGAALQDMLNVLERRHSAVRLLICPVPVQGAQAAGPIAEAIGDLNRHGEAEVILLARGGGSMEDLWAFNEEVVARAIAESGIPVLTGIGHETDFTIADFVSDLRAPTPSAAAELVLPRREDLIARLQEIRERLSGEIRALLEGSRERLDDLRARRGLQDPLYFFEARRERLGQWRRTLNGTLGARLALERERLGASMGKLEALGPLAVLQRGFSLTQRAGDGTIVRRAGDLKAGETVRTVLKDGSFISLVKEIEA